MAAEDSKDILKNVDWKTVGGSVTTESSQPIVKKRLPKKIRQVPDCYFLPRRSWPSALAIYGAVCAAGVGAGMLLEVWIHKKIKEIGSIQVEININFRTKSQKAFTRNMDLHGWNFSPIHYSMNDRTLISSIISIRGC
ncbi:hypothetical protein C2845_PM09G04980 [Panicum miliaceum]|uniref:Uncharacterized protein n=1 Tax=Panicum miliaceum TaxID=4540 RepID=A0A3L6RYM1_PANMI|nr:hypothetical protein C2845_PM09G04980 [Panicum miliaceum]